MICGGRIYKGQDNYIELYVPDASGITGIEIYTGGELKITTEEYEIVDDNTIGINLTKEDLDPLKDGVIYYTVEYEGGGISTNSNYYLKTPVGYTASTLDELIEEAYEEGYEDGQEHCTGGTCDGVYESGYTDGYESGYTEGYESGSTSGYEEGYTSGSTDGYNSGHTDGEAEQKAKLTSTSITENNIYTREDGWNYVTVNVPQTGHTDEELHDAYDSGFTQGEAAQKAKLVATAVTENGIYTREDGFSSVSVNVPQTGYTQQDLDNAYASGYTDGYQSGYTSGYTDGQATCEDCDDAYDSGYTDGYESGYTDGSHSCLVYVQDLIDEGYADVVTGANGTYIEILSGCPYEASQVIDLKEVATNTKQLSGSTANVIVWDQPKATGFTDTDIAGLYSGETLNFTPRGGLLWGLGNIDNFSITFAPGSWVASDYPWGSYHSEGVFAPRYDAENEPYYYSAGFRNTPKNLTVTIDGGYSSVGQVMFTMMKTTTAFTLNVNGFNCHDVTGMFEADTELETLNINGRFYWSSFRTMHNLFDGCNSLTGIPINIDLARDHDYNTIYPHNDGTRGSANCRNMFRNCSSLTYLGPTFNMKAISLSGCVVDNISQEALAGTLFDCPLLSDVHIINLNNNDWNFADASTYTYIPNMSAASIEYLLNNVEDVTSQGGHSVTFANTYKNNVPASAITYAQSMGWNVVWDGDTPVPYSEQYFTVEALESGTFYVRGTPQYSINDGSWEYATITTPLYLEQGDKVRFKAYTNHTMEGVFSANTIQFIVYGNLESLEYGDDFTGATSVRVSSGFISMFESSTGLKNIENLVLPAITLQDSCYKNMFRGCTEIVSAPDLIATNLGTECYCGMFSGCTSLTTAPALPATALTGNSCYKYMFSDCVSLTTAPELPVETLYSSAYTGMFSGCTSLNYIKCLAKDISAKNCVNNWVVGVAQTGTFVKAAGVTWPSGDSGIPSGWAVIDAS